MVVEECSVWLDSHFSAWIFGGPAFSLVIYCDAPADAWELEPMSSSLPITITDYHYQFPLLNKEIFKKPNTSSVI